MNRRDANHIPSDYKSNALPLELTCSTGCLMPEILVNRRRAVRDLKN